jgi:integrase
LSEYDKVHAIELARYLDNDKNGKQWAKATIKNYYSYVRQAFAYAGEVRDPSSGKIILPNHPFHEVKLSEYGFEGKPYLPFTTEELHELFRQEMGIQERLLLTILISTGMRLDEVALMTWERLTSYDNVWCFSLVAAGDEEVTVKNKGSMRYIPVPDVVKPLLGKGSKGRLFDYRIDKEGKAQAKASDAIMIIIRKVTDNDRKVGHSLRGNFKDLVRNLQVSKETNDFLTGHAQGDVAGDRYGKGPSMDERLRVINSIKHPWLGIKAPFGPH